MTRNVMKDFSQALRRYQKAKMELADQMDDPGRDRAVARIDRALDVLMWAPSGSVVEFAAKLRALESEYGTQAQQRHVAAIYADVAMRAAMIVAAVSQVMPGS